MSYCISLSDIDSTSRQGNIIRLELEISTKIGLKERRWEIKRDVSDAILTNGPLLSEIYVFKAFCFVCVE
jgi:hypothetical protein